MTDRRSPRWIAAAALVAAGCHAGGPAGGDPPIRLVPMAEEDGAITVRLQFPPPAPRAPYRLAIIPVDMASVQITLSSTRLTADRVAVYDVSTAPSDTTFTRLRPGDYTVSAKAYSAAGAAGANVALATSDPITVTGGGTPQAVVLKMHLAPFAGKVQ